jgi:hypothetical protein
MDEILSSVTLYWLTETFPRSIYPYRQVSMLSPKKSKTISYQINSYLLPDLLELMRTPSGTSKSLLDTHSSRRSWHQSLRLGLKQLVLWNSIVSTRAAAILPLWRNLKFCLPMWKNFSNRYGNSESKVGQRTGSWHCFTLCARIYKSMGSGNSINEL